MQQLRQILFLVVSQLLWLPLVIAETDTASVPLTAKKPQHAEFERWRLILNDWRARRDQLRTARVKVRGEEQWSYTEQLAAGKTETRILRQTFKLEGRLDLKSQTQRWSTTRFDAQNEIHVQLSDLERIRYWLRNGVASTVSFPLRVWDPELKAPRSLNYWNPLDSGFNQLDITQNWYDSQREADLWYKGFLLTGTTNQKDSIKLTRDKAAGLLYVRLKRFCLINRKPGIVVSELCFNERQGSTLISHKRWIYPEKQKQPEHPFREVTVSWEQVDSIWVPTIVTTVSRQGQSIKTLEFDWSDLNLPPRQKVPPVMDDAPLDWSKIKIL